MINTDIYLKYQAYGRVHKELMSQLQQLNNVQRPSVSTIIKLLENAANKHKETCPRVTPTLNDSLTDVIKNKLEYDEQEKYLKYIQEAEETYTKALKTLNRPTRGQVHKTLQKVLDNAIKELLKVY